jgi:hypothetical protein
MLMGDASKREMDGQLDDIIHSDDETKRSVENEDGENESYDNVAEAGKLRFDI